MHIHNPTNEEITAMYASRTFRFAPDKTIDVEDKASANHILNEFGPRGLVALAYGDDTKKHPNGSGKTIFAVKCADGIKAATAFRRKMVIGHNQMNESNKHTRKPYIEPTPQLVKYAAEMGVKLIKPYEVDDLHQQKMNELESENRDLKGMIKDQGNKIDKMLDAMSKHNLAPPENKEKSADELIAEEQADKVKVMIAKVNSFNRKDYLQKWVDSEMDEIKLWPEEARSELRKKYFAMHEKELHI